MNKLIRSQLLVRRPVPLAKVNIRPGASVLSVLRYLNYRPWFALAEFVDNAVQSFIENRQALQRLHGQNHRLKVQIDVDSSAPCRIIIRDNAGGIGREMFPRAFRPAVIHAGLRTTKSWRHLSCNQ
jgi:hypothetical protein